LAADGGIYADASGRAGELAADKQAGVSNLRQLIQGNGKAIVEYVKALKAIHAVAVLSDAITEAVAIVVQNARIQQVENTGYITVEAVFTRTGEDGLP